MKAEKVFKLLDERLVGLRSAVVKRCAGGLVDPPKHDFPFAKTTDGEARYLGKNPITGDDLITEADVKCIISVYCDKGANAYTWSRPRKMENGDELQDVLFYWIPRKGYFYF